MTATGLPPLAASDFGEFFSALWAVPDGGAPPTAFAWQIDLVEQLARDRRWPDLVDLPTGSGKTSMLEIALFLQALDAEHDPAQRWTARRVVLVVDRRVVVDQADDRGGRIARRLEHARGDDGVLWRVAARLRYLSGAGDRERPVVTSVLRGGIMRDESWAERPDRPALISSTVDQVGSRLLFRGYGISPAMRPVHAGLLANDCLFLLDEVHLARPFAQTLAAIGTYRRRVARDSRTGPVRWHVVELSATPTGAAGSTRFPPAALDPGSHPVLRRRLCASKRARLELVALPKHPAKADALFAAACADAASALLAVPGVSALGVIVNRVSTALAIARVLASGERRVDERADVVLLTGRMRSIDRDRILDEYRTRIEMGRERVPGARPVVVVATQSIESGADFDLDAIVTECASIDALRQRFGRVDRDGRRSDAGSDLTSVILAREPWVADGAQPDPVYDHALSRTWAWLSDVAQRTPAADHEPCVDFGIRALPALDEEALSELVPPQLRAPVMLPTHLDAWVQTNPAPMVEPDVAQWLHGTRAEQREVHVVWRDDISQDLLAQDGRSAVDRVLARPPASPEALSLPIAAVRRWLRRQDALQFADVDAINADDDDEFRGQRERGARRVLRWAGRDGETIEAKEIRPGDTLVVPCAYGGIYKGSWAPDALEPPSDLATIASRTQRRLAILRLWSDRWPLLERFAELRELWSASTAPEQLTMIREVLEKAGDTTESQSTERDADVVETIADVLAVGQRRLLDVRFLVGVEPAPSEHPRFPRRTLVASDPASPFGPTVVITAPVGAALAAPVPMATVYDDDASFSGRSRLTLAAHLSGVAAWTERFALRLGVDPAVGSDLRLAAELHDVGKADARFQAWLRGGDPFAHAGAPELLAKSATPYYDRAARAAAREASRYPRDARHELTSVAMIQLTDLLLARANDPELVLHLVASHHGYCRGFAPALDDPSPVAVVYTHDGVDLRACSAHGLSKLDSGVAERFWRVVESYGWFGLAWLETILRLADHRRSEQESDA